MSKSSGGSKLTTFIKFTGGFLTLLVAIGGLYLGYLTYGKDGDTTMPTCRVSNQTIEAGELTQNDWTKVVYDVYDNETTNVLLDYNDDNLVYDTVGEYEVYVYCQDEANNKRTIDMMVSVIDTTKPTYDVSNVQIEAGEYVDIDWATYILNEEDNSTSFLTKAEAIDSVVYDKVDVYTVEVTVEDESGNKKSQTFSVSVIDTTSPSFEFYNVSIGIDEHTNIDWITYILNEEDNSDSNLFFAEVSDGVTYSSLGEYFVTVKVEDESGNFLEKEAMVSVVDKTSPVITVNSLPTVIENSVVEPYWPSYFTVHDNIDGDIDVELSNITENLIDTSIAGEYSITLTVTDSSGNISEETIIISVESLIEIEFDAPIIEGGVLLLQPDEVYNLDIDFIKASLGEDINDITITIEVSESDFASLNVSRLHTPLSYSNAIQLSGNTIITSDYLPESLSMKLEFEYYGQIIVYNIEIVHDQGDIYYSGFSGGNGSEDYPYLISTYVQLRDYIGVGLDYDYELISDIDGEGVSDWVAIGDNGVGSYGIFTGVFDGAGHSITNIASSYQVRIEDGYGYGGLFASTENALVKNLSLAGEFNYTAQDGGVVYVGSITGNAVSSSFKNIEVNGSVKFDDFYSDGEIVLGGVIGSANDVLMFKIDSSVSVFGKRNRNSEVGGIVGYMTGSVVSNAINRNDVYGQASEAFCITGWCTSVDTHVGGIVGRSENNSLVTYAINYGGITYTGRNEDIGSIIGDRDDTNLATCFYQEGTSAYAYSSSVDSSFSRTEQQLKSPITYDLWNNPNWIINPSDYPTLDHDVLE